MPGEWLATAYTAGLGARSLAQTFQTFQHQMLQPTRDFAQNISNSSFIVIAKYINYQKKLELLLFIPRSLCELLGPWQSGHSASVWRREGQCPDTDTLDSHQCLYQVCNVPHLAPTHSFTSCRLFCHFSEEEAQTRVSQALYSEAIQMFATNI